MDDIIDIDASDETFEQLLRDENVERTRDKIDYGSFHDRIYYISQLDRNQAFIKNIERVREKINYGSFHDRFYYLAKLNRHQTNSREALIKKIEMLTEAYKDLFDPSLPFSTHNVHICRFFFESATRIGEFRDRLLKYCEDLENPSVEDRQHLIDILPCGELKERTLKSLQSLEISAPRRGNDILYHNDTQSAHVVDIITENGKVLDDRSSEFEDYVSQLPEKFRSMKVIDDIRINNSTHCNVRSTLVHVLDIINNHEDRAELMGRLNEELEEMTDTCTTGINARLVNVLSGYSSAIRIALPFEAELKASVFARFNKRLSESSNALREMYSSSITDREKKAEYILFKESMRAELYIELRKEYETMPGFDSKLFSTAFSDAFTQI